MQMKIKPEHFEYLKTEINKTLEKYNSNGELVNAYELGKFARSEKTKNLQERFCFDVLYGSGLSSWVSKTLYTYLNDEHIYTALKQICPTVEKRY